jgi:hypothetical protein
VPETWRPCSACKKPIPYGATYWVCSVSTCNRNRTALRFCTVSCWEVHLPVARHREAWAEEKTAPSRADAVRAGEPAAAGPRAPRRILPLATPSRSRPETPDEILIVASRLKDYVRAISGFNTSDRVLEPLSRIVREACHEAVRSARAEGRKTILDRDVPKR